MKLVPLVETTHEGVLPHRVHQDYRHALPLVTEADLIAAAAVPGWVHRRAFFQDIDDAGEDHEDCALCHMPPKHVEGFFDCWHEEWAKNLDAFGVEWDPSIRL